MNRADLEAFARRNWALLEAEKSRFWVRQSRTMTPAELFEVGERLRRYARTVRPDEPRDADRAADLAAHARVSEWLRRVHRPQPH